MTSRRRGGKSSGKPSVPQPHGGALVPGAGGGRGPGAGRPPSRIRQALRQSFEDRIRLLEEIADGPEGKTTVGDRLRALDILAKYGLGADRSHHDEELVGLLALVTAEVFAGDPRLGELREAWVRVMSSSRRWPGASS